MVASTLGGEVLLHMAAIDLGASSGRLLSALYDGDQVSLSEVRRFPNRPLHIFDRMHWNIYELFQEIKLGLMEARIRSGSMQSLAIDSWAVDFGLLDGTDRLLELPRHYRDARNVPAMNAVVTRLGAKQLFSRTGVQLQPFNTIFQLYATLQHDPSLLKRADSLLLIPDLLNFFLTGEKRTEFTNATTTQVLGAASGDWDVDLISTIGVPSEIFTSIAKPGTVLETVHDTELLTDTSWKGVQVIHTASHDTASAVIAATSAAAPYAYISSGTWSLVGTVVPQPIKSELAFEFNFTNEGGLGNYRLLKNVSGLWLLQETQRILRQQQQKSDIEYLLREAEYAVPMAFVFDPDDVRLLLPGNIPATIHRICLETGQNPPMSVGSLVRGILESLALKYRIVLEQLEGLTGKRYETVRIVGGGAQNELLSQFTANAVKRAVVTGPFEASAMGNVAVQLFALGHLHTSSEITQLIAQSVQTKCFVPQDHEIWEDAVGRFVRIADVQRQHANEEERTS